MSEHKANTISSAKEVYRARREAGLSGIEKPIIKRPAIEQIGTNRKKTRRKVKNRLFTKKGYTRVIKVDGDKQAINIPTKIGSNLDKSAHANSKKIHKTDTREA